MMNRLLRHGVHCLAASCYPQDISCHACGQPALTTGERWLCARCQNLLAEEQLSPAEQPFFLDDLIPCSLAAYRHDGVARHLVRRLKYGDDRWAALPLAEGMVRTMVLAPGGVSDGMDLLIPVPLHPKRERQRGYNQALALARQLAFHTGIALCPEALRRIRHTLSQVGGTKEQRRRNMLGAFEVVNPSLVYRRRVLLLDDVCTTGSTAVACAQSLLACGSADVTLITACKA